MLTEFTSEQTLDKKKVPFNRHMANSVLDTSNNAKTELKEYSDKSASKDVEMLYDMRAKSVIKKREEIFKKKEDLNRQKLNEKMARIDKIQKRKDDQKTFLNEKRQNKSPAYLITQYTTS